MKEKLIIVTGNALKFKELSAELNKYYVCEQGILENYHEIQGTSHEIILHKLHAAYEHFKQPVLVDDSSVHFDELGGFPGPYIKDFIRHLPIYDMGVKFAGTRMSVGCNLAVHNGEEIIIGVGLVHGDVIMPKNIDPGPAEFDLYTKLDGTDCAMIELSVEEKNKISHRGMALKDLLKKLQK